MKSYSLLVVAAIIFAASTVTANASTLTLQECLTLAIHHSPELSAARHETLAAREGVSENQSALLPSLGAQMSAYEVNGAATNPFSALRVFDAENPTLNRNAHWGPVAIETVGINYPLIGRGSILGLNNPPELAAARAAVDERLAGILLIEQQVVFNTVTAYVYAAWYRGEAALASKALQLSEERLEITQSEVELRLKLPQDIEFAQAQVDAARNGFSSAMSNASYSMEVLSTLIGRSDDDFSIDTSLPSIPQLPPLREFLAHVMPSHPALRVQQGRIEIAKQEIRVRKAALYPSVSLNLGLAGAQNLQHIQGNTLSNFLSFLQVDIPIFDFGRRKAAVRASEQRAEASVDALAATDLELRRSIAQTFREITDADERLTASQAYLLGARNAAALAAAERSEGLTDQRSSVETQLRLIAAQTAVNQEQLFIELKYAQLRNLSGGLWHWSEETDGLPVAKNAAGAHASQANRASNTLVATSSVSR